MYSSASSSHPQPSSSSASSFLLSAQSQQLFLSSSATVQQQQQQQHFGAMAKGGGGDRCAVCSDQAQGVHFGVIVCRACAAFFRRSTIAKRVYRCRFEGNCPIDQREVRCSCRACRLAKCISLGMDPSAVQRHRDQIGPRKRDRNSMEKDEGGREEEEPIEMKPRLLCRTSTEETEPHIQAVDPPQTHQPPVGSNLLPPLALMGSAFQLRASAEMLVRKVEPEEEEEKQAQGSSALTRVSTSQQQQQHNSQLLHFEGGKSYALLGSSPFSASLPPSAALTTTSVTSSQHQGDGFQGPSSSSSHSLSDLLLRALPSAFSPIQCQLAAQHHQPDSGNVSANSSAFSSPLNLGAGNMGQQNSPIPGPSSLPPSLLASSPAVPSCLLPNPSSAPPNVPVDSSSAANSHPMLSEMLRGYRKFLGLRRTANHLKGGKCPFQQQGGLDTEVVEGSYKDHVESIKSDMSLLSEMLDEHFQPLRANFGKQAKWSMLRNFFCTFIIAERCHQSSRHFPGLKDTRLFCSASTYLDMANLGRFFDVEQCRTTPADVAKVFDPVFFHFQKALRHPMAKLRLSDLEFIALLGLLFWNHRLDALNADERRVAAQTRERLFVELYHICRSEAAPEEAGIRFCTLLNMHHVCQKLALEIASAYSLVNVLQKFETDPLLNQFHPLMF